MALIKCPDCGHEVSDRAPTCPNCGAPIAAQPPTRATSAQVREVQARSGIADGVKIGCGMFIVLPILIVLGLIIFGGVLSGVSNYNNAVSTPTLTIDNSPDAEQAAARDAITDAHNNGWSWAQAKHLTSPEACAPIRDINTREGCEAYANHPAPSASSEKPAAPSDRLN